MPAPIVWHRQGPEGGFPPRSTWGGWGTVWGWDWVCLCHCSAPNAWHPCVLSEICLTFEGWRILWVWSNSGLRTTMQLGHLTGPEHSVGKCVCVCL